MLQPSPVKTAEKLKRKRGDTVSSDESLSDEDSGDGSDVGQYNNRYRRTMLGMGRCPAWCLISMGLVMCILIVICNMTIKNTTLYKDD